MPSPPPPPPPWRDEDAAAREAAYQAQQRADAEQQARSQAEAAARANWEAEARAAAEAAARAGNPPGPVAHPAWKPPAAAPEKPFRSWDLCLDSDLRVGAASTLAFELYRTKTAPQSDCPGGRRTETFAKPMAGIQPALASAALAADGTPLFTAEALEITNGGSRFRWTVTPASPQLTNISVGYRFFEVGASEPSGEDEATLSGVRIYDRTEIAIKADATASKTATADKPTSITGLVATVVTVVGGLVGLLGNLDKLADLWKKHGCGLARLVGRRPKPQPGGA
ncbi:MAG: hypothetical protein EON95_13940 [Caulobacteraceae bacterium]|nr:MAG: hypothetical protein EON95_13940 [Caulobacteraceae bacterium]